MKRNTELVRAFTHWSIHQTGNISVKKIEQSLARDFAATPEYNTVQKVIKLGRDPINDTVIKLVRAALCRRCLTAVGNYGN